MLTPNFSIISIIVPNTIFAKITYLWQELADENDSQRINITDNGLVNI